MMQTKYVNLTTQIEFVSFHSTLMMTRERKSGKWSSHHRFNNNNNKKTSRFYILPNSILFFIICVVFSLADNLMANHNTSENDANFLTEYRHMKRSTCFEFQCEPKPELIVVRWHCMFFSFVVWFIFVCAALFFWHSKVFAFAKQLEFWIKYRWTKWNFDYKG